MKSPLTLFILLAFPCLQAAPPLTTIAEDGRITLLAPPMEDRFLNPVSAEYESGFRERYNELLKSSTGMGSEWKTVDDRLFFESEKWSYPNAMLHVLAGNVEAGMRVLQAPDQPQKPGESDHTLGIDLFPSYTLKGQTRKYFQFASLMDPDYKATFEKAIALWTRKHPRQTPHPLYTKFDPKAQGWGPDKFGQRQIDARRTDNLFIMGAHAVYLFAEVSGNEETRQLAKAELFGYIWTLYNIGQAEWDSTTYFPHLIAPFLTLYDFAKDPEVKMAAKVSLDYFFTAAALKNHRNTFAGASKRDYGGLSSTQSEAAMKFFALYFPQPGTKLGEDYDQLHAMASAYRPPPAVLALAQREIDLPLEILATKPNYENWKAGQSDKPHIFETLWLGKTVTAGSIVSRRDENDILPLRITFNRGATGTNSLTLNSRPKINAKHRGDQVGQYANVMLWLRKRQAEPFTFTFVESGKWQIRGSIWFFDGGDTWIALHPINLQAPLQKSKTTQAAPSDGPYAGFALEIQETGGPFASFDAFVAAVESTSNLDLTQLEQGRAVYKASDGKTLAVTHNAQNDLPTVERDGKTRDWENPEEWAVWRSVGRDTPVVDLGWKSGILSVNAGGQAFQSRFILSGIDAASVRREQLEPAKALSAESSFENR